MNAMWHLVDGVSGRTVARAALGRLDALLDDAVEIGRAALRDPYWPLRAANKLGIPSTEIPYAPQYVAGAY